MGLNAAHLKQQSRYHYHRTKVCSGVCVVGQEQDKMGQFRTRPDQPLFVPQQQQQQQQMSRLKVVD